MLRRGGEQGIRTLEASFKAYTISSRAPSTSSDNSPYQTVRILYQKGDQNASPFFLKKFQKTLDFIYCLLYNLNVAFIGVWRSLVSRLVRDQEASGSSPDTPTTPGVHMDTRFYLVIVIMNTHTKTIIREYPEAGCLWVIFFLGRYVGAFS